MKHSYFFTPPVSKAPAFAIPMRPHVKQYFLKEFGPEPLQIHQNTFLGRMVAMNVEKQPYRQLHRVVAPSEQASYRLTLPTALKHYVLTLESLREMGETLDKFFQQQLILFVKGQIAVTGNERAALRSFFKLYEINPSDYDLEAARKVFRDYKDKVLKANGHFAMLYGEQAEELFSDYAAAD
ncbi:hypothetical protein [uncultured Hymenobacter sp.]|uniref:hypothetical protein n=1 Tax=uncultured Hymenobacter sp. TaxID=170016 RepID=UPI0035CA9CD2